jgi:hypothetical protein
MPLKVVRFVENSLSFNLLNISRIDIPCVKNDVGEAAQSRQPVTITVDLTPPNPLNSPKFGRSNDLCVECHDGRDSGRPFH